MGQGYLRLVPLNQSYIGQVLERYLRLFNELFNLIVVYFEGLSLRKTNFVLRILIQKTGQECGITSVMINHRL